VKVSGVWFGGRLPSQVTIRRLNHGPSAEDFTPESLTATGKFANLPSAQLGTHWFSRSVPRPSAPDAVQSDQVRPSTRMPSSAHASTIDDGALLSANGSALAQSATTPTLGAAGELRAVVGEAATTAGLAVDGFAAAGELAAGASAAAVAAGEAAADRAGEDARAGEDTRPAGEAVAGGADPDAAEPP
jgi:hypothetical protein